MLSNVVNTSILGLKAEYLLGLRSQKDGSIFDSTGGTLTWIAAGRYEGYLSAPSLPHPSEVDVTGESAFNGLVATVCCRDMARSRTLPHQTAAVCITFRVWYPNSSIILAVAMKTATSSGPVVNNDPHGAHDRFVPGKQLKGARHLALKSAWRKYLEYCNGSSAYGLPR